MKITKYDNPVKCPECNVGMDKLREDDDFEFGEVQGRLLGHGGVMSIPGVFIFRCPKCCKEWNVDFNVGD